MSTLQEEVDDVLHMVCQRAACPDIATILRAVAHERDGTVPEHACGSSSWRHADVTGWVHQRWREAVVSGRGQMLRRGHEFHRRAASWSKGRV
jgi:hypothetical protein